MKLPLLPLEVIELWQAPETKRKKKSKWVHRCMVKSQRVPEAIMYPPGNEKTYPTKRESLKIMYSKVPFFG